MSNEHEALQAAVRDAIAAAMASRKDANGRRWNASSIARAMDRPYDSTRNYLSGDRAMPLEFLLAVASTLGVPADEIVRDARENHLEKHLEGDS